MRERATASERQSDRSLTLDKWVLVCVCVLMLLVACAPPRIDPLPTPPQEPVFCTADVQECPDGSFVSRQPPDCAFAACPEGSAGGAAVVVPEAETAESCAAKGGVLEQHLVGPVCNLKTTDGGKTCTSSDQCEGKCIAESPADTRGMCSGMKLVYGCINVLKNGQVTPLCID